MSKVIVLLGNSHLGALKGPAARWRVANRFVQMQAAHIPPYTTKGGRWEMVEPLSALLGAELAAAGAVISSIGGNGHNVFGLVEHPRPFYFFGPGGAHGAVPGREVVSRELVKSALKVRISMWVQLMKDVRGRFQGRMLHLQPPPPVEEEEHIRSYPGPFAEQINANGVAPAFLRLGLWHLHSELLREVCEAEGIEFVPAPASALSAKGYLRRELMANDPSHANSEYGRMVLDDLEGRIDASV